MGGYLNFTLHPSGLWGISARRDPISNFFVHLIDQNLLVDIESLDSRLTWSNKRATHNHISKRLDQFLIKVSLLLSLNAYKSSTLKVAHWDHPPILLELLIQPQNPPAPFKLTLIGYCMGTSNRW